MSDKRSSYYNTLIFTIVAAVVSLLLLLLLFIQQMKQFLPFIITLEIGIFFVILWCITIIWLNAKDVKNKKENAISVKFDTCPDYFTKINENDKIMCKNMYPITSINGVQYKMVFYPADSTIVNDLTPVLQKPTNLHSFELNAIEKNNKFTTSKQRCAVLFDEKNDLTDDKSFKDYDKLPWTTMRSKCASLY
jgi:hypothetical protein